MNKEGEVPVAGMETGTGAAHLLRAERDVELRGIDTALEKV